MSARRQPAGGPPRPASAGLAPVALALVGLVLVGLAIGALAPAAARDTASSAEERPPAPQVLDRRPAEGQQCIVCRLPTQAGEVVEVRYKGRRFYVAAKMLADFEAEPEAYFHQLEAHGGLFDEAAMETPPMKTGWLVFGLYVLAGLVAAATCAYVALDRGLPAWRWFFAGLAVNLLAVAAILTRRRGPGPATGPARPGLTKIPITHSPLACGHCGESNHPAAAACSSCGRPLEPTVEPETART